MSRLKSVGDLFLDDVRALYDAEEQVTKAFAILAEAATAEELSAAIERQLEEARTHLQRLEEVFELLDQKPGGRSCASMADILDSVGQPFEHDERGRDAEIAGIAQRAAHYQIGAYDELIVSAAALGNEEITDILRRTLEEKKVADETLQSLSEGGREDVISYDTARSIR